MKENDIIDFDDNDDPEKAFYDVFGPSSYYIPDKKDTKNPKDLMKIGPHSYPMISNHIDKFEYIINTIKKTVKCEDILSRQILYTG
ncbi:MAG: hypothetical protein ACPKPY_13235, partial [Nitrososphaeraceae archaeon]